MLYWLFTTYRDGIAFLIIGGPLLCLSLPAIFVGAYLLGPGGPKTAQGSWGPRQKRIVLTVQAISGLAALHLAIAIGGFFAIEHDYATNRDPLLTVLVGPPQYDYTRLGVAAGAGLLAGLVTALAVGEMIREGGPVRELIDRLRDPWRRREEMGSAHFCFPGDFTRLARPKPGGLHLLGAFYGKRGPDDLEARFYRLDAGPNRGPLQGKTVCFSIEDQARGLCLIGPPGSGKSQAGVLPIIGDTMAGGNSLIVADPQGELSNQVLQMATVTGHLAAIHDPTDPTLPRFNLAAGMSNVADAQAIAQVMVAPGDGSRAGSDGGFWTKAAQNLLAGCLIRFDTLGDILVALTDIKELARILNSEEDEARLLCGDFIHSALQTPEQKLALNIASSLKNSNLANWAAPEIREATSGSDISAGMLVTKPAVLILKCPGRYRDVYGPYLGAVLQKLIQDLDTIGEESGGPLPRPVKIVLDEFPALGRLEPVVTAVNLVRKRHISIVIAAQTLSQLERLYGTSGANALLAGMATQIYFGSCDAHTAQYVSRMLGKTTERIQRNLTDSRGRRLDPMVRQRDLMTPDEVITPPAPNTNCTLIYRYATETYATQIVLLAHLTRMYQREDWGKRIAQAERQGKVPIRLERPPSFTGIRRSQITPGDAPASPTRPLHIEDEF